MDKNSSKILVRSLVTHDGSFHTDDIFACATLQILLDRKGETYEVVRTRDPEIIAKGDFVFDVGGVHDAEKNKFDHHQTGGAGKHDNGIEYASFGLVWTKYGIELCGDKRSATLIEKKLASPVDAWDNGIELVTNKNIEVSPYFLQHIFFSMEPTWREQDVSLPEMFQKSVALAKEILLREIIQAKDAFLAEEEVTEIYKNSEDKRIIVLDKIYPFQYTLNIFPEPLFVVYPRKTEGHWGVKAVRNDPKTFNNRKDFPKSWAGLSEEELQKITGVGDAVFCHRGLFMAVAKSKEGAIKLAQIAVESN